MVVGEGEVREVVGEVGEGVLGSRARSGVGLDGDVDVDILVGSFFGSFGGWVVGWMGYMWEGGYCGCGYVWVFGGCLGCLGGEDWMDDGVGGEIGLWCLVVDFRWR